MKILVLDFGLAKTHVSLNKRYFSALSELAQLYIINSAGYYDSLKDNPNIVLLDTDIVAHQQALYKKKKEVGSLLGRYIILDAMRQNKKAVKQLDVIFDWVLVVGYEIITFALYRHMFKGYKTIIFEHQQITELTSSVKRHFFMKYANSVRHIVLSDSFNQFLKGYGVKDVYTVHYLGDQTLMENYAAYREKQDQDDGIKRFISISSTNDEGKVEEVIRREEETGFFQKNNIHYHIRSKEKQFDDGYLTVDNKYLSTEEYYEEISSADANVSLNSDNYGHRLSGWILDAALCGIPSITPEMPLVKEYQQYTKSLLYCYHNIDELLDMMKNIRFDVDLSDVEFLRNMNSQEAVIKDFGAVIGN